MFSFLAASPRRALRPVLAGVFAILLTQAGGESHAQLTAANLIGDSVSDPGAATYSDVGEAIKRFGNRDVLSARQFLETAKRKDPKLPPVGVMLAKMYALTKNAAGVRPALEQSINDEADDPEPYLLLAESTLQAGQTIEADALFDKAVDLVGSYDANRKRKRNLKIRAYRGRASVDERRRNWDNAEADLRVWLEEDPENAAAYSRLGQVLCMLDRVDQGRQAFVKAKQLDDKLPSPYVMTARVYERRGEQSEAIGEFKKAYAENPKDETTLIFYAQSLIRSGDLQTAAKVLRSAREVAPGSFNVWLLSGVSARMLGNEDAAERMFMQGLNLKPDSRDAFDQLAQTLASQEDDEKRTRAVQFASTNARLYPKNTDVKVTLAWAVYQTGRKREAITGLQNALQSGGGRMGADAQVLVAKMYLANNQEDIARRLLTAALADNQGIFVQRAEAEQMLATLN